MRMGMVVVYLCFGASRAFGLQCSLSDHLLVDTFQPPATESASSVLGATASAAEDRLPPGGWKALRTK